AARGKSLQERGQAGVQLSNHVRSDRVIEHRRRAHLHGAAAEEEVVERVVESGDAADAREALVGERLSELRHLGQRQRQNRRPAPPRPPVETRPSTLTSKSSVSGSISGSDVNVFDETTASAPPRNAPRASTTMSVVDGVSFAHTGTVAMSFTTLVTIETSSLS